MIRSRFSVAVVVVALAVTSCGDDAGPAAPAPAPEPPAEPSPSRAEPPEPEEPAVPRDPRLREDCGGWEPAADLLDDAAQLGDEFWKGGRLQSLDSGPLSRKVDVLRAGLRLSDDEAARACAAQLEWQWIDGWECARCVALLTGDVLRPESEADYEKFRSYLGTVDLPEFVDALPPTPWSQPTAEALAHLHRILDEDMVATWAKLIRSDDADIADEARTSWWSTVAARCAGSFEDELYLVRPELERPPPAPSPGLPSSLVMILRTAYLSAEPDEEPSRDPWGIDPWTRRWCFASAPGPQDEPLLLELARGDGTYTLSTVGGVATILLGRLRGADSDAFLREEAADDDTSLAWIALALRGDRAAIERLVAWALEGGGFDEEIPLAALMEADPKRARAVVADRIFGDDERGALATLEQMVTFLSPGWTSPAMAFDTRRTTWEGFEERARTAKLSALRRAMIAVAVPGCRTRAVAEAACRDLDAAYFTTELPDRVLNGHEAWDDPTAFLETAAPEAFRAALRRVAAASGPGVRRRALEVLVTIGDPASGATLLELMDDDPFGNLRGELGLSASPEVVAWLRDEARAAEPRRGTLAALAVAAGAPDELAGEFEGATGAVLDALVAGDWRAAFHGILTANPDAAHGDVGVLKGDADVVAYLHRFRARRELGGYWYATGQLAAMGEEPARTEWWRAMQDGRYRIAEDMSMLAKTLGGDLRAAMPFWIEQLRSNCCRVATSPWKSLFDVETFLVPWRTPYASAKDIWEAGTGPGGAGFAWSRIRRAYVLAAR